MEYTEEQFKAAARKAYEDGNIAAAKRLIAKARSVAKPVEVEKDIDVMFTGMAEPRPAIDTTTLKPEADMSVMGRIKDNVIGVDDGVMSGGEKAGTLLGMGLESLTLGLAGDELRAKGDSVMGLGNFEDLLAKNRANEAQVREENPAASFAADVAPALVLPGAAIKSGLSLGQKALRGGMTAGASGGLFGFMEGEGGAENRLVNGAITGGLSAALGGAAPVAGAGFRRMRDNRALNKAIKKAADAAPDNAALKAQAGAIFDAARATPLPNGEFAKQYPIIAQRAQDAGMRNTPAGQKLAPKSSAILSEISEVANNAAPMAFDEIHDLRKLTNAATGDFTNSFDQTIGKAIRDGIDEAVENIDPTVSKEIAEANKMWKILRKSEQIDEIFARASTQASGFENGLRIEFRAILKSQKKRAQFTSAELAAMRKVVKGTNAGNFLKKLGKLGFGRGAQTNVLSGTAGAAVFGPAAAISGQAALAASESVTARQAKAVQDLVRIGGVPNVQIGPNQNAGLLEMLLQRGGPRAIEGAGIAPMLSGQ